MRGQDLVGMPIFPYTFGPRIELTQDSRMIEAVLW
jgi:hypothetical protein